MIVLPLIIFMLLTFVFQSGVSEIQVQQLRLNCPWPVNSGTVTGTNILPNNVTVTYNLIRDNDTDRYHVTIFRCGENNGINAATTVYTADVSNAWFAITNRSSGFMFYVSESITELFQKGDALAHLVYLYVAAPAIVTGLAWFGYLNAFLLGLVALGIVLIARGT